MLSSTFADESVSSALERLGLPCFEGRALPSSTKRFPDGAHYRIEIPSVEGPEMLSVALEAAGKLGVPIHRVSQGSGVLMLTRPELRDMATIARDNGTEVSLFARPGAEWGTGGMVRANGVLTGKVRGHAGLVASVREMVRAAEMGFRSVLVADEGLLWTAARLRDGGDLPPDMQFKVSVMLPVANAASARIIAELGASTLNLPTDLSLEMIASIREAIDLPLDIYIESPDDVGGFVRQHEVYEIIRVAAPVYIKLGVRNAPNIYPYGAHLRGAAEAMTRERVRRAAIVREILADSGFTESGLGASDLAIPTPVVDRKDSK